MGRDYDLDALSDAVAESTQRWAKRRCPLCHVNDWAVEAVARIDLHDEESGYLPPAHIPCGVLTCTNCGNTIFINLVTIGALAADPDE